MVSPPNPAPGAPDGAPSEASLLSETVDVFVTLQRQRATLDAVQLRALARAARLLEGARGAVRFGRDIATRSFVAELAAATRMPERTVEGLLGKAADLCERFALVVDALGDGALSLRHVDAVHEFGAAIVDDDARAEYVRAALERAVATTPARLRAQLRTLAERFLERTVSERAAHAAQSREVRIVDLSDGMAELTATLPAVLAHGIYDRLTQQSRAVLRESVADDDAPERSHGCDAAEAESAEPSHADDRSIDHVRADVFTDLLLTSTADRAVASDAIGAIRARVQLSIPVLGATGASSEPCVLAGHGPIDSETATRLAAAAPVWTRVLTSPITGAVLHTDRYRPTADMLRLLGARDEHCRFPGCRAPIWRCDVDHTIDHAHGGPTAVGNLAHLCRRHHTLKHASPWTVTQDSPGVLVWTSPSGRRHTDHPEPTVRFIAQPSHRTDRVPEPPPPAEQSAAPPF